MKNSNKRWRIFSILMYVILVGLVFALAIAVRQARQKQADPKKEVLATATATLSPTPVQEKVTIEFEKSRLSLGELVVWTTKVGFHRAYGVVDFKIGDATNVTGRKGEVVAMWITRHQGTQEAELWAVFMDGSIEQVVSPGGYYDHRLPFGCVAADRLVNCWREGFSVTLAVEESAYYLHIQGLYHNLEYNVLDYNIAYDTIYWLVSEGDTLVAYCLNWSDPEAEPEVYYRGCNSLSHYIDEAEGCLVPLDKANSHYYDRVDLYTPYPNGGGWDHKQY